MHLTDACWLWIGHILKHPTNGGYGIFQVCVESPRGPAWRRERAHKIAYEMFVGRVPDGRLLRHTCDVRNCVRPSHLICGTVVENVGDMIARGRMPRGERRGHAKLTVEIVREIRHQHAAGAARTGTLAAKYGVSHSTISNICHYREWKHVTS